MADVVLLQPFGAQQHQLTVADLQVRQAAEGAVELASVESLASWVTPGATTGLAVLPVLAGVCRQLLQSQ